MSISLTNSTTLKTMQLICNTNLYFDLHITKRNNFLLETLLYSSPYKVPFELKLLNNVNDESQGIFGLGGNLNLCYELEKTNDNSFVLIHPTKEREIFERWIDDTPTTDPVSFKETVFIYQNEEKNKTIILNKSFENVEAPEDLDYELFLGGTRVKFPLFQDNQNIVKCNKIIVKDNNGFDRVINIEYQQEKIKSIETDNKLKDKVLFEYDTETSLCNRIEVLKSKKLNNETEEYFTEMVISLSYNQGRVSTISHHYYGQTSYQAKTQFIFLADSVSLNNTILNETVTIALLGNQGEKFIINVSDTITNYTFTYSTKSTKISNGDSEEEYHFDNNYNLDFIRDGNGKVKVYKYDTDKKLLSISDWVYEDVGSNTEANLTYYKKYHPLHNVSVINDSTCPSSSSVIYAKKIDNILLGGNGSSLDLYFENEGSKNDILNIHVWSKIVSKISATNNVPFTIKAELLDENENVLETITFSEETIELNSNTWTFKLLMINASKRFKKVKVKFFSSDIVDEFKICVGICKQSSLSIFNYDNKGTMVSLFDGKKMVDLVNSKDKKYYNAIRTTPEINEVFNIDASGFTSETYFDEEEKVTERETRYMNSRKNTEVYDYDTPNVVKVNNVEYCSNKQSYVEYDEFYRIKKQGIKSTSYGYDFFDDNVEYSKEIQYSNNDDVNYGNIDKFIYNYGTGVVSENKLNYNSKQLLSSSITNSDSILNNTKMSYSYDDKNRLVSVMYDSEVIYSCAYDEKGRMTHYHNGNYNHRLTFLYNEPTDSGPAGTIKQVKYANAPLSTFSYDEKTREVISVENNTTNSKENYEYDGKRLCRIIDSVDNQKTFEETLVTNEDKQITERNYRLYDTEEDYGYFESLYKSDNDKGVIPIYQFECDLANNSELSNAVWTLFNPKYTYVSNKQTKISHYLIGNHDLVIPTLHPNIVLDNDENGIYGMLQHIWNSGVNYLYREILSPALIYQMNLNQIESSIILRLKVPYKALSDGNGNEKAVVLFAISSSLPLMKPQTPFNDGYRVMLVKNDDGIFVQLFAYETPSGTLVTGESVMIDSNTNRDPEDEFLINLKFDMVNEFVNEGRQTHVKLKVNNREIKHLYNINNTDMKYLSILHQFSTVFSEYGKIGAVLVKKVGIFSDDFFDYFVSRMNEIESKARESKKVYVAKTFGDNDFDKISFNKTLNSTSNLKPSEFFVDDGFEEDSSFEMVDNLLCECVDRYVYKICNQTLKYDLPLDNSGTIILNVSKVSGKKVEFIHLTNKNDIDILLRSDENNVLYCEINGSEKNIGTMVEGQYYTLHIAWSKIISSGSLPTSNTFINVFVDGVEKDGKYISSSLETTPMEMYLGRKKNSSLNYCEKAGNIYNLLMSDSRYTNTNESVNNSLNEKEMSYYKYDIYNRLELIATNTIKDKKINKTILYEEGFKDENDEMLMFNIPNEEIIENSEKRLFHYGYIKKDSKLYSLFNVDIADENKHRQYNYIYDGKDQLIRVDISMIVGQTSNSLSNVEFSYDNNGNIVNKKRNSGVDTEEKFDYTGYDTSFTYDGIKLISYNNNTISYEGLFPKTIKNSSNQVIQTFEWIGSDLTKLTYNKDNVYYNFKYNYKGLREVKEKYVNSLLTYKKCYNYDIDGRLISEKTLFYLEDGTLDNTDVILYKYDVSGRYFSMTYNGASYYYIYNMLGDLLALTDVNGNIVAKYAYDPFGMITVLDANDNKNTSTTFIGNINPIRYKGYYYDVETGMFWLSSRYYSPELCRFISPDDVEYLDPESVNGLNLYCYCLNNPISYVDPSGHWIETVFDLFSLGVSIVEVVINPLDPLAWAGLAGDAVDLIPFVTGVGETIRGVKIVAKGVDLADDTLDTIKIVRAADRAGDFIDGGLDMARTLDRTTDGLTISNKIIGSKIHKTFMGNGMTIPGTRLRVDGLKGLDLFELKPFNKNSLRRGVKQVVNYNDALGGSYKMFLVLY